MDTTTTTKMKRQQKQQPTTTTTTTTIPIVKPSSSFSSSFLSPIMTTMQPATQITTTQQTITDRRHPRLILSRTVDATTAASRAMMGHLPVRKRHHHWHRNHHHEGISKHIYLIMASLVALLILATENIPTQSSGGSPFLVEAAAPAEDIGGGVGPMYHHNNHDNHDDIHQLERKRFYHLLGTKDENDFIKINEEDNNNDGNDDFDVDIAADGTPTKSTNNEDDLAIESNSLYSTNSNNNQIHNSDTISPVVVNSGPSSYVSASPILASPVPPTPLPLSQISTVTPKQQNQHNHRHPHNNHHHYHMMQSSKDLDIITTTSDPVKNGTYEEEQNQLDLANQQSYLSEHQEPFERFISDKKESFLRHNIFSSRNHHHHHNHNHQQQQQHKRSNVHKLDESNKANQVNDEALERDNLPAEMFISSPFGAKLNSLRSKFSMNPATIIQTRESLSLGATFLNHTYVKDFNSCLHDCWQTFSCDTAIYQETPAPKSTLSADQRLAEDAKIEYICYLFSCVKGDKLICKFTSHNYYVSSFLKHHRPIIQPSDVGSQQLTENPARGYHRMETMFDQRKTPELSAQELELHQLRTTSTNQENIQHDSNYYETNSIGDQSVADISKVKPRKTVSHKLESNEISPQLNVGTIGEMGDGCQKHQFRCQSSSECIAIYNVCDGINQCPDGSDETNCPAMTTEPTLIIDAGDQPLKFEADVSGGGKLASNYEGSENHAEQRHRMNPTKDQQFHSGMFRNEIDNSLPAMLARNPIVESGGSASLSDRLYQQNEANLGIEGFFDKNSGRFITYHDSSNPFYILDGNVVQANDLFPGSLESEKTTSKNNINNYIGTLIREKPPPKPAQEDQTQIFHYKPSSSVDFLQHQQQQHKTFLVPTSYNNKMDQSDKKLNFMGKWQNQNNDSPKQHKSPLDNQNSIYRTPIPRIGLSNLDKISISSDETESTYHKEKDQHNLIEATTISSLIAKLKNHEDVEGNRQLLTSSSSSSTTSKPVSKHNLSNQNGTVITKIAHHERQPVMYNQMRNGRFHANKPDYWHDSHIASITIGQEEYDDFSARGTHSALIAFMFGIAITGMLIVIVGLKMKSIRNKLVRRGRRRSLVHEADFLINGMYL